MEPESKRQKFDTITGRRVVKSYKRHDKPPYSYLGMVALIIQTSPDRQQSLAGIINTLMDMFPFFQGEYQGWKDSVRHNLTNADCFYKVEEFVNNVKRIKRCNWAIDFKKLPGDAMVRQDCRKTKEYYAPTLTEHFNLPPLLYVPQGAVLSISSSKLANPPPEHFDDSFREPRQRVSRRSTPRPFSIEAILESSRKSQALCEPAYVRHIHFPKTMFDDQTPEKALENLRQLCGTTNPLDAKTLPLDTSIEARASSSLCDITNTSSMDSLDFSPLRGLKIGEFGNFTPRPESFTKRKVAPKGYGTDSENVTPTNFVLSTPQRTPSSTYSFTEPVTPTNVTSIQSTTPSSDQKVTSTPHRHQPRLTNVSSLHTPLPSITSSPLSTFSFPGSTNSPILSPVNLSLSSPPSFKSPSSLFGSPALHTSFGSSYIDRRLESPHSSSSSCDAIRKPECVLLAAPEPRIQRQVKHPDSFSQGSYFYSTPHNFT